MCLVRLWTSRALPGKSQSDICIYGLLPARKRATRIKERQLLAHIILFKRVLYVFLYLRRVLLLYLRSIPGTRIPCSCI
jgi:predicted DNA-binding transcriptional regulator